MPGLAGRRFAPEGSGPGRLASPKFRSVSSKATRAYRPRGLPNLRPLHLCLPSLFNAAQGVRTPFASPAGEQQRWVGSTRPTDEGALRQGGSRERRLGRRSRVGVDEVPCQGRSGRTRGRRSPTSPPQHPQRGTCLHLLGAGTSTSTIAFSGEGKRTRRGWLGGGIWSPGPCVPGAGPLGAQAGPRVRPESPAETGSDNVCRPDQGDVVRVQAVRVRARAQGPGLHGGDVIM